jgi:hypothetical protein
VKTLDWLVRHQQIATKRGKLIPLVGFVIRPRHQLKSVAVRVPHDQMPCASQLDGRDYLDSMTAAASRVSAPDGIRFDAAE